MSNKIRVLIAVVVVILTFAATFIINTYYDTDKLNTATADEASFDMAEIEQQATFDETMLIFRLDETETPTEAPTEKPTEELITQNEEPVEEKSISYTPEISVQQVNYEQEQEQEPVEVVKPTSKTEELKTNSSQEMNNEELLTRLIYLEAGSCSEYCQWLVGSAIMNLADSRGGLAAIAYNPKILNVAGEINTCTPSQQSRKIARRVLSGDRDYKVYAFRLDYYHDFGTPYTNVDNVYFTY